MSQVVRLVVLLSGNGSNLQAIIDHIREKKLPCQIAAVVSNRKEAYGLVRASCARIPTFVVEHQHYADRSTFESALADVIDRVAPDLVVLAGFMRVLTPAFVQHYRGRIINIHPSLLPKFPGLNTHHEALVAHEKIHGATVHFVTEVVDGGPIIIQGKVPILKGDTPTSLQARVHHIEHKIYPLAIQWIVEGRVLLRGKKVYRDNMLLPQTGFCYSLTGGPERA